MFLEIELVERKSSLMYYLCFNLYVFSVRLFFALEWKTVLRTHPANGCTCSWFHKKCTIDGSEELLGFDKKKQSFSSFLSSKVYLSSLGVFSFKINHTVNLDLSFLL